MSVETHVKIEVDVKPALRGILFARISMMRLADGKKWPWYMGLAWYDHYADHAVLMLIPINLVGGVIRRIYLWVRNPWDGTRTRAEQRCFEKGYRAGRHEREILKEEPR